jgi:hypothetical protein
LHLLDLARCAVQAIDDETIPHYRWRVKLSDRTIEVCCLPELTAAEMLGRYPGAELEPPSDAAPAPPAEPLEPAPRDPMDDRQFCTDCVHLTDQGLCLAAYNGKLEDGRKREYYPTTEPPRRCECFIRRHCSLIASKLRYPPVRPPARR